MKKSIKYPLIFILTSLAVGGLAAAITKNSMSIYESLSKPPLSPPPQLFPIVWFILYILMGLGTGLMYSAPRNAKEKPYALSVFFLQLAANFFWSIIFFNLKLFTFAFFWLLLILALVLIMVRLFSRISKASAILQLPYVLWLVFAAYLNIATAVLN